MEQLKHMVSVQIDLSKKENQIVELVKALNPDITSKEKAIKKIITEHADQNPEYQVD